MPAPGLVKLGFLRLRFSNNFAVGSCGVGCPKIVFALGARPKTEPQAIQMQSVKNLSKLRKATKMEWKGLQKGASGARRYQNVIKREQNGTKRNQNGAKSYQHGATGCQKGAQRRPKCIQKSPWAPRSILGAKKGVRGVNLWILFEAFFVQKALKNQCKIRCRKKHEISWKNLLKREPKSMPKLIKNQCQNL